MRYLALAIAVASLTGLAACSKPASETGGAVAPAPAPTEAETKALIATLPAPYNGGDPVNGKAKFALCRSCHTVEAGGSNMTGPNLHGVFGNPAGRHDGYSYSQALTGAGLTWDAATLDRWITNPREVAPGNKMGFVGLKDAKDRTDVIAYLKVATN